MKITKHVKVPLFKTSSLLTFMYYEAEIPTKNTVIYLHGIGEIGAADGSQLHLVEKLNGWPKFAKGIRPGETTSRGAIEYPFNILAVQVPTASYGFLEPYIVAFAQAAFQAKNIAVLGISMGGFGTFNVLRHDFFKNITAFVILSAHGSVSTIPQYPDIPGLLWHGDQDEVTQTPYSSAVRFVTAWNSSTKKNKINFKTIAGGRHNSWDHAFHATDPTKDQTLQFVIEQFKLVDNAYEQTKNQIITDLINHLKTF